MVRVNILKNDGEEIILGSDGKETLRQALQLLIEANGDFTAKAQELYTALVETN